MEEKVNLMPSLLYRKILKKMLTLIHVPYLAWMFEEQKIVYPIICTQVIFQALWINHE